MKQIDALIAHVDGCPACTSGKPCMDGKALLIRAQQVCAALATSIPDVPRPRVKA